MEINKEEYEMFLQFKAFLNATGEFNESRQTNTPKKQKNSKGSVFKLSGNRNKPYRACVTVGYDNYSGKQLQETLGYFKHKDEGQKALEIYFEEVNGERASGSLISYMERVEANFPKNSKLEINVSKNANKSILKGGRRTPTLEEIYTICYSKESELSNKTLTSYNNMYNARLRNALGDMLITQITLHEIQPVFDKMYEEGMSKSLQNMGKIILSKCFDYAMKYDFISKDYSKLIEIRSKKDIKVKNVFDEESIKKLFAIDDVYAKATLVLIYTGMRINELCNLNISNVHFDEEYLIGGSKTESGKNRVIPIHPCISSLLKEVIESGKIVGHTDTNFRYNFNILMKDIDVKNVSPHCTRHTFATLCNRYELNDYKVKIVLGHKVNDITKDVYTHVKKDELINEIKKLPVLK